MVREGVSEKKGESFTDGKRADFSFSSVFLLSFFMMQGMKYQERKND